MKFANLKFVFSLELDIRFHVGRRPGS